MSLRYDNLVGLCLFCIRKHKLGILTLALGQLLYSSCLFKVADILRR